MSTPEVLAETLIKWAATRSDHVVFNPAEAYYSFDIVADAFDKGKQSGISQGREEAFEKGKELAKDQLIQHVREKYYSTAKFTAEAFGEMLQFLRDNSIPVKKLFIRNTVESAHCIFSIPEETYIYDNFIDLAYKKVVELETKYHDKDLGLQMGFINDDIPIDFDLLRSDGFGFAINIDDATKIY
jgi:hypothetical protein